jgi:hypothetical protein
MFSYGLTVKINLLGKKQEIAHLEYKLKTVFRFLRKVNKDMKLGGLLFCILIKRRQKLNGQGSV